MAYIDGYLVPVPENRLEDYKRLAAKFAAFAKANGVIAHVEAVAEDVKEGKWTDFYRAVDRQPGETVVFSYVVYPSREARDSLNAKMMADPAFEEDMKDPPFDGKRMVFGGFKPFIGM